jgi:hypothetical protein
MDDGIVGENKKLMMKDCRELEERENTRFQERKEMGK